VARAAFIGADCCCRRSLLPFLAASVLSLVVTRELVIVLPWLYYLVAPARVLFFQLTQADTSHLLGLINESCDSLFVCIFACYFFSTCLYLVVFGWFVCLFVCLLACLLVCFAFTRLGFILNVEILYRVCLCCLNCVSACDSYYYAALILLMLR